MNATELTRGTRILGNGDHLGTIIRQYDGDMYEIRYPGGECCHDVTSGTTILRSDFTYAELTGYLPWKTCHLCVQRKATKTEQLRGIGPHNPICDRCLRTYRFA